MLGWDPTGAVAAFVVDVALGAPTETDETGLIGLGQFPGPASFQPLVGDLHLPAVADQLVENPELVADAVTGCRDLETGQGFHVASGQAAEATVAKTGLLFNVQDLLKRFDSEVAKGFLGFFLNAQIEQVVVQLRPDQELGREIGHRLLRMGAHRLGCGEIAHHQAISNRIAQGHVEVMATGGGCEFAEREEQVLGHAVEHALGIQAGAFGIVVATGGRQAQIQGLGGGHGEKARGEKRRSPRGLDWEGKDQPLPLPRPNFQRQLLISGASMPTV